jgi:hypothetical protein
MATSIIFRILIQNHNIQHIMAGVNIAYTTDRSKTANVDFCFQNAIELTETNAKG